MYTQTVTSLDTCYYGSILLYTVEAVVKEDQVERPAHSPPLDVTVLTNDVSFLCDTKQECHKRGLNRFWERMRPLFEDNAIRSIEICVAETGSIVLSNAGAAKKSNKADGKKKEDGKENADAGENKEEVDDDEISLEEKDKESLPKHEVASTKCIQNIKAGLSTRAEADYKKTRSSEDPPPAVVVNCSCISNDRLGYHVLVQKWLNELLALARDKVTVSFELPENLDGMQCALSLDATYKVFPYRADSLPASMAMKDLQLLTQSKFEVLQLVPLSCVDGALIFGQPMEVRAKLENDLAQYNEMKALVGNMLRFLSEKEVALMLRATDTEPVEMESTLCHEDGQTFLLMVADLPCRTMMESSQSQSDIKAVGDLPSWGTLVRYAVAEQLLDSNCSMPSAVDGYADSMKELSEFVEGSMEEIPTRSTNPVFDYTLRSDKEPHSEAAATAVATVERSDDASASEDTPWTDKDGVGALVVQGKANNPDDTMDDITESDDSLSDGWGAFNYD